MQKQTKIIAIAVFAASIAGIAVATAVEVQAQTLNPTHPDVVRLSPQSFGAATAHIVCGDRLCSDADPNFDVEEDTPIGEIDSDTDSAPTVELISIDRFRQNTQNTDPITFRITFSVTAGVDNLRNIEFEVQSDVDKQEFEISSLNALSSSINVIRIRALDADSITGELTAYSITGPTGGPLR